MKKTHILVAVLATLSILPVAADTVQAGITYVDIPSAQTLIDTLTKENDTMATDNSKMQKEISDSRTLIANDRKSIADVSTVQDSVKLKSAEIVTLRESVSDNATKAQLDQALDRNTSLDKKLTAKILTYNGEIQTSEALITKNLDQISVNNAKTDRNKSQIILLAASIDMTKGQQAKVAAYMKDVDSFLATSDALAKDTATAPAAKP